MRTRPVQFFARTNDYDDYDQHTRSEQERAYCFGFLLFFNAHFGGHFTLYGSVIWHVKSCVVARAGRYIILHLSMPTFLQIATFGQASSWRIDLGPRIV